MLYKKRKLNGQFRSKKNSDRLLAFHTSIVLFILCIPLSVAINIPQSVTTYQAPHIEVRHVDAQEPTKVEKALRDIPHTSSTTDKVLRYLYEQAEAHGIDGDQMAHTIWCETGFYNFQSDNTYDFTDTKRGIYEGQQELSFGIFQIHLPDHPEIKKETASNSFVAIEWAIKNWNVTKNVIWYAYDREKDQCNNKTKEYWKND